MPVLRFTLFGGLNIDVLDKGRWRHRQVAGNYARSLLAYLAFYTDLPHFREDLIRQFAPDYLKHDEERARKWIRNHLTAARQALTIGVGTNEKRCYLKELTADGELIEDGNGKQPKYFQLNSADIECDVAKFRKGVSDPDLCPPERAIAYYKPNLLLGFHDPWIDNAREELRKDYLFHLMTMAERCYVNKSFDDADKWVNAAFNADPVRATEKLMKMHHGRGRIDEFEQAYLQYQSWCLKWGSEPYPVVEAYYTERSTERGPAILPPMDAHTRSIEEKIADLLVAKASQDRSERTEAVLRTSITDCQEALRHCPHHAGALAALADAHTLLGYYSFVSPREAFGAARRHLDAAMQANPDLPQALTARAWLDMVYRWQWQEAQDGFERAKQKDPLNPTTRQWYAFLLMIQGRYDDSRVEIDFAYRYCPGGRTSPVISKSIGQRYHYLGRYEDAITQFELSLEDHPYRCLTLLCLGLSYEQLALKAQAGNDKIGEADNFRKAIYTFNQAFRCHHVNYPSLMGALGYTYAKCGRRVEALAIYSQLLKRQEEGFYVSPVAFGTIHVGLGELKEAIVELEKAVQEDPGPGDILLIGIDPRFKPLRSEGRFSKVLTKVGLKLPLEAST